MSVTCFTMSEFSRNASLFFISFRALVGENGKTCSFFKELEPIQVLFKKISPLCYKSAWAIVVLCLFDWRGFFPLNEFYTQKKRRQKPLNRKKLISCLCWRLMKSKEEKTKKKKSFDCRERPLVCCCLACESSILRGRDITIDGNCIGLSRSEIGQSRRWFGSLVLFPPTLCPIRPPTLLLNVRRLVLRRPLTMTCGTKDYLGFIYIHLALFLYTKRKRRFWSLHPRHTHTRGMALHLQECPLVFFFFLLLLPSFPQLLLLS